MRLFLRFAFVLGVLLLAIGLLVRHRRATDAQRADTEDGTDDMSLVGVTIYVLFGAGATLAIVGAFSLLIDNLDS